MHIRTGEIIPGSHTGKIKNGGLSGRGFTGREQPEARLRGMKLRSLTEPRNPDLNRFKKIISRLPSRLSSLDFGPSLTI